MKRFLILLLLVSAPTLPEAFSKDSPKAVRSVKPIGKAELYWLMNRACYFGDELSVQMLLNAGSDPNGVEDYAVFKRFEPSWPINQASWNGHIEVVNILLEAGAKVDLPEGEGFTALTIATTRNHPKLIRRLLDAGANINYKTPQGTALEIARLKGFVEAVKILEAHTRK